MRKEADTLPGPVPPRTACQGGAVAAAWMLVAGLIALVVVTPLLLPRPLPMTGSPSPATALPAAPVASHARGE